MNQRKRIKNPKSFNQHGCKPNLNRFIGTKDIKLIIRIITVRRKKEREPGESEGTLSLYIRGIQGVHGHWWDEALKE